MAKKQWHEINVSKANENVKSNEEISNICAIIIIAKPGGVGGEENSRWRRKSGENEGKGGSNAAAKYWRSKAERKKRSGKAA